MKKSVKKSDLALFVALAILVVLVFGLRMYFVGQTETLSYDAYYQLRLAQHVAETGVPLRHDPLSYGGRTQLVSPFFSYVLAVPLALFNDQYYVIALTQLFMSLIPIIVFFTVRAVTNSVGASAASAAFSAFVPVFFSKTLHSLSPLTLAVPLTFLALLFFLRISQGARWLVPNFIIVTIALSLLHSSGIFFVAGLVGYLIICKIESIRFEKAELELIFFSAFLFLWLEFLMFKSAFLVHGAAVVWQNIPSSIISQYFADVSISFAFIRIGVLPLLGGLFCIYLYLFSIKDKRVYLYIALSVAVALAMWLRLVQPVSGFLYLGVCLSILSGPTFAKASAYLRKTRFSWLTPIAITAFVLAVLGSLALPAVYLASEESVTTVPVGIIDGMEWLNKKTPTNITVLASLREGHLVTGVAMRRNVVDDKFILREDAEERLIDVEQMFTAPFLTKAAQLFEKYDVDYIFFSDAARLSYNLSKLPYEAEPCISQVYQNAEVVIYKSRCRVETTGRRMSR